MSAAMLKSPAATRAFRSSTGRKAVACHAQVELQRRAALGICLLPAFLSVPRANALLLDDEDEEMVEKAKANRSKRLAQQRETTRQFIKEEGLGDRRLDQELVPVQKAVYQLAKSGSQLESGDLKAVSSTLSGSWVSDFEKAALLVSTSEDTKSSAASIFSQIGSLKSAAGSGDLKGSKQQFVAVVQAVQSWVSSSGLSGNLKGL